MENDKPWHIVITLADDGEIAWHRLEEFATISQYVENGQKGSLTV